MGPLKLNQQNPRYFEDDTGTAIYLTGSHTWPIFQDWQKDGREYLNADGFLTLLKDNNHNFTRGWVCKNTTIPWPADNPISVNLMMYQRTGPGKAWDGKPKSDLYKFNEQYFTNLRNSVIKFRDNGIYFSMMMFYDTARSSGVEWNSHIFNKANNINGIDGDFNSDGKGADIYNLDMLTNPGYPERREILTLHEAFVRKIIDTIGDLDNVIWEVGNEINYPDSISFQHYFIDFIREYESTRDMQHPVGLSADWNDRNNTVFDSSADWIAPNVYGGIDYANNPPANSTGRIIFLDTDHMGSLNIQNPSPSGDKEKDYRQWTWMSLTRGFYPIVMDDPLSPWDVPHIHALPAARRYLGDARSYAERVNLSQMVPHGVLSSTRYCLASPGKDYIIYQKLSGQFNVNIVAGIYLYEWFNPVSGVLEISDTITVSNGQYTFTPPSNGDMVLFLSRIEYDPCEGVVCDNICIGKDLYSQKCDPATGTCVPDQLIEMNSSQCGYDLCGGVVCENICLGNDLYSQKCDPVTGACIPDQLIESNSEECGYNLCEGVVCPIICDGYDLWSQKCNPDTGACIPDQLVESNSELCGYDPCEGVVCNNICDGYDLWSQKCDPATGACIPDQLVESNSELCGYDPCEGVVCPIVCVGNDLWSQKCDPDTGACIPDQLLESNSGLCVIYDPCEGVTCPITCVSTDIYSQKCVDGICVTDQLLESGSELCSYDPCVGVVCPYVCVGNDLWSQKCNPETGQCVLDELIYQDSITCKIPEQIPADDSTIRTLLIFGGLVSLSMLFLGKKT